MRGSERPGSLFPETPVDEVARYWDSRPCNIRHSSEPVGTARYFEEVEARKYMVEPHIPDFADFDHWANKRVLEIGCGIGTDTINFARSGARVTAVDISEESLKLAAQRTEVLGLQDSISFYCANAEELDKTVPVEAYDLVYSFGVIHHTPHPERAVEQAAGYLKAGGTCKLMVYHRFSWKVLGIILRQGKGRFWRQAELVARYSEAQEGCPVTYTFSRRGLRKLLERSGFRVEAIDVEHIFPYRVEDYVRYCYVWVWYFRVMPRSWFHWLEHRLGWHMCATAIKL